MRIFYYAGAAFLVNYILFESFPLIGGGGGLGLVITIPIIIIISAVATIVHYFLEKYKYRRIRYFQLIALAVIVIASYSLFLTDAGNSPFEVIMRMRKTAKAYHTITLNDYFTGWEKENFEVIVAAKKKFKDRLFDTAYVVNVHNYYETGKDIKNYGVMYYAGQPMVTNAGIEIKRVAKDAFKFRDIAGKDTISFYGNSRFISYVKSRSDSFMDLGEGHPKDTTIRSADTFARFKNSTPDEEYWAYKIFYWLL